MSGEPKETSEILKGQLGLIALVALLSGTVYADTYYAQFGKSALRKDNGSK